MVDGKENYALSCIISGAMIQVDGDGIEQKSTVGTTCSPPQRQRVELIKIAQSIYLEKGCNIRTKRTSKQKRLKPVQMIHSNLLKYSVPPKRYISPEGVAVNPIQNRAEGALPSTWSCSHVPARGPALGPKLQKSPRPPEDDNAQIHSKQCIFQTEQKWSFDKGGKL